MATEKKRKRQRAEVVSISSDMMMGAALSVDPTLHYLTQAEFFAQDAAGRQTHASTAPSRLPLDTRELNRQALIHQVLKTLQNDQCWPACVADLAVSWPADTGPKLSDAIGPTSALDCGTGSGEWALEFAEAWPDCHVTAFDLAPVQPISVPHNLFFELRSELDHRTAMTRNLIWSIHECWKPFRAVIEILIEDFARVLRPTGLLVVMECGIAFAADDTEMGPAWLEWNKQLDFLAQANGFRRRQGDAIAGFIRRSRRFRSVQTVRYDVPFGTWPHDVLQRELGHQMMVAELELMHSTKGDWIQHGLEIERLDELRAELAKEMQDPDRHLVSSFVLTYAYRL